MLLLQWLQLQQHFSVGDLEVLYLVLQSLHTACAQILNLSPYFLDGVSLLVDLVDHLREVLADEANVVQDLL